MATMATLVLACSVAMASPHGPTAQKTSAHANHTAKVVEDVPTILNDITQAARQARELCYPRIHHDTLVFEDCLDDLGTTPGTGRAQRLGIAYFGWVGAMNSSRMGMQGSADTAARFLAQIKPLQRRLKISDLALCQTIPGDCDVRTAQLLEQRKQHHRAPPKPEETGHAH